MFPLLRYETSPFRIYNSYLTRLKTLGDFLLFFFRAFFLFSSHSLTRCFSCLFVSGLARRRRYCNIRSLSGVALSGATLPLPYGASCRWWLGMNFSRGTSSCFEEADVFWPSLSVLRGSRALQRGIIMRSFLRRFGC